MSLFPATGFGPLPIVDPAEAARFVVSVCPQYPYWPRTSSTPGMWRRIADFLPDPRLLALTSVPPMLTCTGDDKRLEDAYADAVALGPYHPDFRYPTGVETLTAVRALLARPGARPRCLKVQITGPLTMLAVRDTQGTPLGRFPRLRTLIPEFLLDCLRRLAALGRLASTPLWIQIDEPALSEVSSGVDTLPPKEDLALLESFLDDASRLTRGRLGMTNGGSVSAALWEELPVLRFAGFEACSLSQLDGDDSARLAHLAITRDLTLLLGIYDPLTDDERTDPDCLRAVLNLLNLLGFEADGPLAALRHVVLSDHCLPTALPPGAAPALLRQLTQWRRALIRNVSLG